MEIKVQSIHFDADQKLIDFVEEKLNKLKLVLNKVDDADFGICIRCGEPIPIGRVLLMPQSRNCVRCAQ